MTRIRALTPVHSLGLEPIKVITGLRRDPVDNINPRLASVVGAADKESTAASNLMWSPSEGGGLESNSEDRSPEHAARRIRALVAVHPWELEPIRFITGLRRDPIENVSPRLAVVRGVTEKELVTTENFAWSLPGIGGPESKLKLGRELNRRLERKRYVRRRAAEVAMQGWQYGATVDFHRIIGNCTRFAQIDREYGVSGAMLGALATMGMTRIVQMSAFGGTPHFSPDTAVAEMEARDFALWEDEIRIALGNLANSPNPPIATPDRFEWFELVKYSPNVKKGEPGPECLKGYKIEPFQPLPEAIVALLGYPAGPEGIVCLQGWSEEPNPLGFWTDLVVRTKAPINSQWSKLPDKPPFYEYYRTSHAWQSVGRLGEPD